MVDINETILNKFKEIASRLVEIQKQIVMEAKINLNYYKIVTALGLNKIINQTKLSSFCNIDKPATSRLLVKMQEENLIEKTSKDGNKKNVYISLSTKGKNLFEELKIKYQQKQKKFFNELDLNDKKMFLGLLDKSLEKKGEC